MRPQTHIQIHMGPDTKRHTQTCARRHAHTYVTHPHIHAHTHMRKGRCTRIQRHTRRWRDTERHADIHNTILFAYCQHMHACKFHILGLDLPYPCRSFCSIAPHPPKCAPQPCVQTQRRQRSWHVQRRHVGMHRPPQTLVNHGVRQERPRQGSHTTGQDRIAPWQRGQGLAS